MEQIYVVVLSIVIGTLAALVYTLRLVVKMNEKIDRIAEHIGIK